MYQATVLMGQEKYESALYFLEKAELEDRFNIGIYR